MKKITFLLAMLLVAFMVQAQDKTALEAAITSATLKHDTAAEGLEIGRFDVGSKALLQTAITAATTVKDNTGADQTVIDAAVTALERGIWLFDKSEVLSAAFIFYETFGRNSHHTGENAASSMNNTNPSDEHQNSSTGGMHYFNERINIKGAYASQNYPGASPTSTLHIGDLVGHRCDSLRIQKINTSAAEDPKLRMASIFNWRATSVYYSTDQGATWDGPLTMPDPVDYTDDSGWQLYTFVETLPKVSDLWFLIKPNDGATSGGAMTQIDDIAVFDAATMPADFNFNLTATNVSFLNPFAAIATKEVFNPLDLSDITDVSDVFELKKNSAPDDVIAITGTISGDKKTFTISTATGFTPEDRAEADGDYILEPQTDYIVTLKARAIAAEDGIRVPTKEFKFRTAIDTIAFNKKMIAAQGLVNDPAIIEGDRNGYKVPGSKQALQNFLVDMAGQVRVSDADQNTVYLMTSVLQANIDLFNNANFVVDFSVLNASIAAVEAKKGESDYAAKYDEACRDRLDVAYLAAKAMNSESSQSEVDAAKVTLDEAIDGLWLIGVDGAAVQSIVIDGDLIILGAEAGIQIYSASGALVLSAYDNAVNISGLAAGIYIVKAAGEVLQFVK